jgi:hypothetical protein
MPDSANLWMLEFLSWISSRRRTYAEAMNAWQSTCPRHTIWEDAIIDGLIQLNRAGACHDPELSSRPAVKLILRRAPLSADRRSYCFSIRPPMSHNQNRAKSRRSIRIHVKSGHRSSLVTSRVLHPFGWSKSALGLQDWPVTLGRCAAL